MNKDLAIFVEILTMMSGSRKKEIQILGIQIRYRIRES